MIGSCGRWLRLGFLPVLLALGLPAHAGGLEVELLGWRLQQFDRGVPAALGEPWKTRVDGDRTSRLYRVGTDAYLVIATLLFGIGMFGFLARRNAISMLMAIELMLNAVNLSIVAFGAFVPALGPNGSVIALMVMAVAAAEATVGLAIIIAIFRNKRTPLVDEYDAMRQ